MTSTQVPTLLTLSQASKELGGSPCEDTLRSEVKKGNLRAKRIGRCLRVTDVELRRWALDTTSPSTPTAQDGPPPSLVEPGGMDRDGGQSVSAPTADAASSGRGPRRTLSGEAS